MCLTYVLLSPTFGMHQYTADLAGRTANCELRIADCRPVVRLVTTATLPRDRYRAAVQIETPVTTHGTGFAREGLDIAGYRAVRSSLLTPHPSPLTPHSSLVHFTGVHLWNIPLVYALRRQGIPVVHTLHDLEPHLGVRFSGLIRLWNRLIIGSGCHLLVHGRRYREQLLAAGIPAERITYAPLLHGFLGADRPWPPQASGERTQGSVSSADLTSRIAHSAPFTAIFFGRVEAYKGIETLLATWRGMQPASRETCSRLVIAGPVARGVVLGELPPGVELRDRRIMDDEADALFRSADLLVLPYRDATQSALVAAAYAYGVPALVTDTGALPEYVTEGETGWIVPPDDPQALAVVLRDALSDRSRLQAMGVAARAWFAARRQEEETALANMYQSLL